MKLPEKSQELQFFSDLNTANAIKFIVKAENFASILDDKMSLIYLGNLMHFSNRNFLHSRIDTSRNSTGLLVWVGGTMN